MWWSNSYLYYWLTIRAILLQSISNLILSADLALPQVTKDDIIQQMMKVTEGVVDVFVCLSASDKSLNRGFVFVQYDSHRSATAAKQKLITNRIQLWGHNISVKWAKPELELDEEIMSQVCLSVCVRV